MGRICEHNFQMEDPKNSGYSMTEYDLYAKLGMTIRKNLKLGNYEIVRIKDGSVVHSDMTVHQVAQKANELEGADNTEVECGSSCKQEMEK